MLYYVLIEHENLSRQIPRINHETLDITHQGFRGYQQVFRDQFIGPPLTSKSHCNF